MHFVGNKYYIYCSLDRKVITFLNSMTLECMYLNALQMSLLAYEQGFVFKISISSNYILTRFLLYDSGVHNIKMLLLWVMFTIIFNAYFACSLV